jgi:hypothetical protein
MQPLPSWSSVMQSCSGVAAVAALAKRHHSGTEMNTSTGFKREQQALSDTWDEHLNVRFTHTLTMDWMLPGIPPPAHRSSWRWW